jgi:hypothetical protein
LQTAGSTAVVTIALRFTSGRSITLLPLGIRISDA